MITAFQVLMLFIITLSFIVVMGERKNKDLRVQSTAVCIGGMLSFVLTVLWL